MFKKNKKEKKENATNQNEVFSINNEEQITPTNVASTPKVEIKKKNTPKKPNVLWAKILVVLILTFLTVLGLYKFVNYLDGPKNRVITMINSTNEDFKEILSIIEKNDLYTALSASSLEVNTDTKMTVTHLNTKDPRLENVLNKLSYISNVKLDRETNTGILALNASKDNTDKFKVEYIDKNNHSYIKTELLNDEYLELSNGKFNLKALTMKDTKYLLEFLSPRILNILENAKFTSTEEAIALNERTVDCEKTTYSISSTEFIGIIEHLKSEIKTDSTVYYYISKLLNINASELDIKIDEYKRHLSDYTTFELNVYNRVSDKEGVRLELKGINEQNASEAILSYNRSDNFKVIEYKKDNKTKFSVNLQGTLGKLYTLLIVHSNKQTTITTKKENDETIGKISSIDRENSSAIYDCDFSFMIKSPSTDTYSISWTIDLTFHKKEEEIYKINSSSLINTDVKISTKDVTSKMTLENYLKENNLELKTKITDSLSNIDVSDPPIEPIIDPTTGEPTEPTQDPTTSPATEPTTGTTEPNTTNPQGAETQP